MINPHLQSVEPFEIFLTKQAEKEFLALPISLQAATADVITELKLYGKQLTEPEVKSLTNGLKELRAKSREGISRSFFFFMKGKTCLYRAYFSKEKPENTETKS